MEELLQQKNYYCKPNSGLKMNCKLISGLINKNCKLFLGRYSVVQTQPGRPGRIALGNIGNK